jgi:hypothetical protein
VRKRNHLREQGRGFKLLRPTEDPAKFGAKVIGYYRWRFTYRGQTAEIVFDHTSGVWNVKSDQPKVKAIGPHKWGWFPPDVRLVDLVGEIKAAVDNLDQPKPEGGQVQEEPRLLDLARSTFDERMDWTPSLEVTVWAGENEPVRFFLRCDKNYVTLLCSYRGRDLAHGYTVGVKEDGRWQRFLLASDYSDWQRHVEAALKIERSRKEPNWQEMDGLWVSEPAEEILKNLPEDFRKELLACQSKV